MLVFEERGKPEHPEKKTSRSTGENQQQTQPTCGVDAGIWTRATLVGGYRSHHRAIPCSLRGGLSLPLSPTQWLLNAANAANKHHPPLFTLPSTDQSPQHLSHKRSHLLLFSIYEVRSFLQRGPLFTIYCKSNRLLVQTILTRDKRYLNSFCKARSRGFRALEG